MIQGMESLGGNTLEVLRLSRSSPAVDGGANGLVNAFKKCVSLQILNGNSCGFYYKAAKEFLEFSTSIHSQGHGYTGSGQG
jgi:hypothetical protein